MKNSQSKFSNKKINSEKSSKPKPSSVSGCCCGIQGSKEVDEMEVFDIEEK